VKRPGTGKILAEHFDSLLGKKATRAIAADEQLDFSDFK
jgi:sialic acid synthase SpsE